MDKSFKGVISNWSISDGGRVNGICVFHTNYDRGIEKGKPISTSPMVAITNQFGAKVLETNNSYYVLI